MRLQLGRVSLGLTVFLCMSASASALPITVEWTGDEFFNSASNSFTGFTANALVSITDTGTHGANTDAYVHSHGSSVTWKVDLLVDGSWTTVLSGLIPPNGQLFLADNGLGATFTAGLVQGIRFDGVNPDAGTIFHSVGGASFTFDTVAVPEPGSGLFLAFGLACAVRRLSRQRIGPPPAA